MLTRLAEFHTKPSTHTFPNPADDDPSADTLPVLGAPAALSLAAKKPVLALLRADATGLLAAVFMVGMEAEGAGWERVEERREEMAEVLPFGPVATDGLGWVYVAGEGGRVLAWRVGWVEGEGGGLVVDGGPEDVEIF